MPLFYLPTSHTPTMGYEAADFRIGRAKLLEKLPVIAEVKKACKAMFY